MQSSSYWQHFSRQRLSRRGALKVGAAGLGTGALALAGCGGEEEEAAIEETPVAGGTPAEDDSFLTPTGKEETPVYGGHSVNGTMTVFGGLDVQLCVDCYAAAVFHGYLYSVDRRDESFDAQVAESMERVDDLTYVWKLRPGVKFHNVDPTWGRELTAEDVVYSMTRRRDDPTGQSDKQLLRDQTDSFEATDKYTFRLATKTPFRPAFDEIGDASYAIVPREAVEKWGDLQQHAVGFGAYILEEFVRGERVKWVKNPDFYMEGRPYIDSGELITLPDESTFDQAFRTGQIDSNITTLDRLKVDKLKKIKGIVIRTGDNYWQRTLMLKVDRPPFDDIRVRKAIDLAIDRQDLIDKMAFGEGKVAGPIVPDMDPYALPQEEVDEFYKLDLSEAKQLLAAAGYEDGLDVELKVQNVADLSKFCEVARGHLAKIGVNCKLVLQELGVYLAQTLYAGNFEMTCYYNLPYDHPDRPLLNWHSKGQAGFSFSGYNNPEADEWIRKEREEFDPEKRLEIIHDAQRFFMTEHGPVILTHTDQGYGAYWDRVHGGDENQGRGAFLLLGVSYWLTERR